MEILTSAKAIRKALRELKPTSIAVAYVGSGWKNYVSTKHLREIVLSPRFGSNPHAIEEMMRELEHENVYFLDDLHSKIYLGADAALLGSCNLSDNGISDNGRLEAAVLLVDKEATQLLAAKLKDYKAAAKKLYPTKRAKIDRLKVLKVQFDKGQWHGLTRIGTKSPSIQQYESELDRIHICWYEESDDPYNKSAIDNTIPEAKGIDPDDYFEDVLLFLEEDDVRPGDWVLCWHRRKNGMPRKNGEVSWLYVHHVVSDGIKSDDYPKLVGEAKSRFLRRPLPPFELDEPTKRLIRKTLSSGSFPELLLLNDSLWHLGPADAVTPAFISALKDAGSSERGKK